MPDRNVFAGRLYFAAGMLLTAFACAPGIWSDWAVAKDPASTQPALKKALPAQSKKNGSEKKKVAGTSYLSVDRFPAGKECRVVILLDIEKDWHINANPAGLDAQIPTTFAVKSKLGTKLSDVRYPAGKQITVKGFDSPLSVYEKKTAIYGTLKVPAAAAGKTEELELEIRYQACNDDVCLPPKTIKLTGKLAVAGVGEPVKEIHADKFRGDRPRAARK